MRFTLLLVPTLILGILGCQRPQQPEGGPVAEGEKLKIVFIPKQTGNAYFTDLAKGIEDASKDLGHEFVSTGPATGEATAQIPIIKEQVQSGADVIILSANSPDALNAALDDAAAKGVLILTVDSDLTGNESHRTACVLQTDFSKIGESQIELLGSQIGYEGDFAILSATRDAPNQNEWIAGMKETLKQAKYSKMKLVDIVYGDDEPQKSTTEAEALLSKHPNLRGIVSPTSVGLAAAAQSLEIAGVYPGGANAKPWTSGSVSGSGIALTGLSTPNQMRGFVEKGVVKSFQLWSPADMGRLAAHLAHQIKSGSFKATEGAEFDAPGIGKRTLGKHCVAILGPLLTFDKANISEYDF